MRQFILVVVAVLSVGCQSHSAVAPSSVSSAVVAAADQPSAADRFAKDLTKAIKKAWGDTSGDLLTASRFMAKTTIASIAPALRQPGTIIAPLPTANQIAVPADTTIAKFTLTIAAADKAAVGNSLTWAFEFSTDNGQSWVRTNAATWLSYGPAGYTNRDGVFDPDPFLEIPLTGKAGQLIRMVLVTNTEMTIGLSVTVT